ncbi:TPA: hypothetical protein ENS27_10435 [bacterium]|nr:hypothetical protein [bacterium]
MSSIIPNTAFFLFTFHCAKQKSEIKIDGNLSEWDKSNIVPDLMHLSGQKPFADVYFSWDYDNLYIGWDVPSKNTPVEVDLIRFWTKDCMELWLDLRNEKPSRRYNEHCHHFFLLPKGNKSNAELAAVGECREPGASIQDTIYDHKEIEIASIIRKNGYSVEARIPQSVIPTYDPSNFPKIGFNYHINNTDRKAQWWSCGTDFLRHIDPSTWGTIELIDND